MSRYQASRNYIPLWCKTHYSFLEGASAPDEFVSQAAEYGLKGIGLSDRDGLYAAVRTYSAAQEHGLQVLYGAQLQLSDGILVCAYALDSTAYAALSRLITLGRSRRPKGESQLEPDDLCTPPLLSCSGLVYVVPIHDITISGAVHRLLERLSDVGAERLFLGAVRHEVPEDRSRHRLLMELTTRFSLSTIAFPELLYHDSTRSRLQDVMTCIRHGVRIDEAGTLLRPNNRYALPHPALMRRRYADMPQALQASVDLLDRAEFDLGMLEYRYPEEPLPEGYSREGRLRELCFAGARRRYGDDLPPKVQMQLETELALITELRYEGYFLTMYEIVAFCRRKGILCQGRGSAANSVVCYSLGVTAVDPVRMQLLFERFLSRERAEPPDIDLDIEHHRREEVIHYVYERYGREHAAMVANVIRYRPRSAVRDLGKVLGISSMDIERISRLLGYHPDSIEGALRDAGFDPERAPYNLLKQLSMELCYAPRHLSIHPGGFLLGAEPIAEIVPVENGRMEGRSVIQWDKYDIEDMKLFKVDLLGLGALTHLRMGFMLLREHYQLQTSMSEIPQDDPAVYTMLERADTVGVFQLESRAQMAMLPRMHPREFYDLVVEISIVRPGPITGGMVHPYLKRRAGEEEVNYPHPELIPVLERTLGVPIFQEQVMRIAMIAADYTPGEADQLRRDMAAWRRHGVIERHHDRIVGRMVAKGIEEHFAEQVFDQIRGFGEYGFPESHAASFALIAYATSWLRARYPVVFSCALLNAWPMGFYSPATILEDARRRGIQVLPLCIVHSSWDCCLEVCAEAHSTESRIMEQQVTEQIGVVQGGTPNYAIRMGFRYLKGFHHSEYDRIAAFRTSGTEDLAGLSPAQLRSRIGLATATVELLSEAGALHLLEEDRRRAYWRAGMVQNSVHTDPELDATLRDFEQNVPNFPEVGMDETILWDYELSGSSTTGHPMQRFRELMSYNGIGTAEEIRGAHDKLQVRYAGMVICRQRPSTAGGIVFVTLEDETGFVNLIFRSAVFERFRAIVIGASVLGVQGRIQRADEVVHVLVESCFDPLALKSSALTGSTCAAGPVPSAEYIGRDGRPVRITSRDFH